MKIRRGFLILGAVSVPLLLVLLIWRLNRNSYRAPGGVTSLRIHQAIMIISELPIEEVPKGEFQLIALLKRKWPPAPEEGSAENQILDGWGRPLAFSFQAATLSWRITSADRDGQFGTSDDKKGESMPRVAETSTKNAVLTQGMHLTDARKILAGVGATEVEGAYPLFWSGEGDSPGGTHTYYHLTDRTCIQLCVADTEPEKTVVAFGVGPTGKPYRGKLEWFSDDEVGRIARPLKITLSSNGELSGAGQSATRSEPKPESNRSPRPESEGRSR